MTTAKTPDQINDELAASRRATERLQAEKDRLDAAQADGRRQAQIDHYTEAHGAKSWAYRDARDQAQQRLDAIAAAETLDVDALRAAFIDRQLADAHAGAISVHASQINHVLPLEDSYNGAPQSRRPHVSALYQQATWSGYLDRVINQRADAAGQRHLAELQAEAAAVIDAAGEAARRAAAAQVDE
jgi:hypothetical protein